MKKFAEIIDRGECISQIQNFSQIPWPDNKMKSLACKQEWLKHDFYPQNGLVAEIVHSVPRDLSIKVDVNLYILKINDKFYVPMTEKGIKFISEDEYNKRKSNNVIRGMDERQRRINYFWG
jgi:hypothetical protein